MGASRLAPHGLLPITGAPLPALARLCTSAGRVPHTLRVSEAPAAAHSYAGFKMWLYWVPRLRLPGHTMLVPISHTGKRGPQRGGGTAPELAAPTRWLREVLVKCLLTEYSNTSLSK